MDCRRFRSSIFFRSDDRTYPQRRKRCFSTTVFSNDSAGGPVPRRTGAMPVCRFEFHFHRPYGETAETLTVFDARNTLARWRILPSNGTASSGFADLRGPSERLGSVFLNGTVRDSFRSRSSRCGNGIAGKGAAAEYAPAGAETGPRGGFGRLLRCRRQGVLPALSDVGEKMFRVGRW